MQSFGGRGVVRSADDVLGGTKWVAQDMMDAAGKSADGACNCVGGVMADDGALCFIFLVGDVHCCFCGGEQCG